MTPCDAYTKEPKSHYQLCWSCVHTYLAQRQLEAPFIEQEIFVYN